MADISIVIRTLNEEKDIGSCLHALVGQSIAFREVLIVDNRSEDRTIEIAKTYVKYLPIKIIDNPERGYSTGLNLGAKVAGGKFLAYLSADTIPSETWLSTIYKIMISAKAAVVQGTEILSPPNMIHEVLQPKDPERSGYGKIVYFNNSNTLYDRGTLLDHLPFEGELGGEDSKMSLVYKKDHLLAIQSFAATVKHNKFSTQEEFKRSAIQHGILCRQLFVANPLRLRFYLNPIVLSCRLMVLGLSKREKKFFRVAHWNFTYTLRGMFTSNPLDRTKTSSKGLIKSEV